PLKTTFTVQSMSTPPRGPLTSVKRTVSRSMRGASFPSFVPRLRRTCSFVVSSTPTPNVRTTSGVCSTGVRPARARTGRGSGVEKGRRRPESIRAIRRTSRRGRDRQAGPSTSDRPAGAGGAFDCLVEGDQDHRTEDRADEAAGGPLRRIDAEGPAEEAPHEPAGDAEERGQHEALRPPSHEGLGDEPDDQTEHHPEQDWHDVLLKRCAPSPACIPGARCAGRRGQRGACGEPCCAVAHLRAALLSPNLLETAYFQRWHTPCEERGT